MKFLSGLLACILVASHSSAYSPLQFERERGFPFQTGPQGSAETSSPLKTFTKARLPTDNVLPISYELEISPILDEVPNYVRWTAPGSVRIIVSAGVATNKITLNSVAISIDPSRTTVKPVDPADTTVFTATGAEDAVNEFYVLSLDKNLVAGKEYEVYLVFVAPVETDKTKLSGLYQSIYIEPDTGTQSYIATTQFEASAARQAFPCFDEPWIKANFTVKIGYIKDAYIPLGNEKRTDNGETAHPTMPAGWIQATFQETVKMSTYLVAIIVAKYKCVEAADGLYDKPAQICGTPHAIDAGAGQYAADTSAKLLKFYESHYGIDYKLSKMDSVAIPDFQFGAMENWGLNIYREPFLLHYAGVTTEAERFRITSILSHELAHQWFGNLVTAQWWSQIWLNEGFATYNEVIGTEAVNPEFSYSTLQQNDVFQLAMVTDGDPAVTHPLVNAAQYNHTNVELMVNFDRITYEKGGSLIRMMDGFLGPTTFKAGLINYLHAMSFQGAHQDDLFNVLTEQGHTDGTLPIGMSVKEIMDTWSLQSGYPVVRVTRAADARIYLSQERFSGHVEYAEESQLDPNELWTIPVSIATSAKPDFVDHKPDLWIEKDVVLKSAEYDTTKWLVVNAGATGYYRVLYDNSLLQLILAQLAADSSVISEFSRSQLIDDYFTLAAHQFTAIENAVSLTKYLGADETRIVVWNAALTHLRGYFNKLSGTGDAFDAFKTYIVPRLAGALLNPDIGLEQPAGEQGVNVILRAQLLDWACALEHAGCREYGTAEFAKWNVDPALNPVPIDIQGVLYCAAVASDATNAAFTEAKARYRNPATSDKDKGLFLSAMACSNDVPTLNSLLEEVRSDAPFIPDADIAPLLEKLAANPQIRNQVINYVLEHVVDIITRHTVTAIKSVIGSLSTYVGTLAELADIEATIAKYTFVEADLAILNGYVAVIRANIVWRSENEDRLKAWFTDNL